MSTATDNTFPLFFQKPAPVDSTRHAKSGISLSDDLSFSRSTNSIAINAIEFAEVAKHYPIVFTQGDVVMPTALVGLEQDNYFVDAKGQWAMNSYIPAYVRKYPFVFMEVPEENQFVLCVDEAASSFREKAGKNDLPFFDGENPAKLTSSALEFCTEYQQHNHITRNFCQELIKADLLVPTQSDVTLGNGGRAIKLAGFQIISEEKVRDLPDATIIDFHKKGWLPLIYFALMSSSNWQKLTNVASVREAEKTAAKK